MSEIKPRSKGHGSKYERRKEQAILALLTERSIDEAARSIGVEKKTLMRWMQLPDFDEDYLKARRDGFSQGIARLQQNSSAAAATILRIMVDNDAPQSSRLRAADRVLEHGANGFQLEDLHIRLKRLEEEKKEKDEVSI